MRIDTKLDIDQQAYMLFQDKVYKVIIEEISLRMSKGSINVKYTIKENPAGSQWTKIFFEHELFETKQDLLNSL